ncbi:uncharacterized protein LOC110031260 [Phalaenopsis equestris]|uniref:uncharacterized protein LOC110031260 n=1 Tax=Phalaenopsis equestris TaxID=78828 RepID=UPI0009E20AF4|nr:uncharacterized protein LOC110031260 [Phalaenopsis equestris]XP_020590035.1 uncharacterized protein LOC110031260 [Phalaenopsis equestris]
MFLFAKYQYFTRQYIKQPAMELIFFLASGITTSNMEMQNINKTENFRHHDEEEHTSQITEAAPPSLHPPKPAATPLNLNSPAKTAMKDSKAFTPKQVMKENSTKPDFAALGVDLNEPLHPSPSSSECGSTTGQAEISESMKKWIEMKQNGFVSIVKVKRPPLPQPKRHQSIKNKELNERIRVHHPTQLLSGLNQGIIKHVRNSKQVNSIIKANVAK